MKSLHVPLLISILVATTVSCRAAPPKDSPAIPPPSAQAYFLLDLETGRVLAEKNSRQRMFPASTTKIMTCLVALEHADISKVITVTKHAAATGESGVGLQAGEKLRLGDLIRAAMIKSANDACVAIADGVAGSSTKFIGWMNKKAKDLGCTDTQFVNPHGLHNPQHYSSAHDLAVIGRAALKNEFIDRVSRIKTDEIPGNAKVGPTRVLINRNKLLFRWPQCDGLKTGYTRQAGNCLVATATMPDPETKKPWRLLAVVLKCGAGHSWPDAKTVLLKEGFSVYKPMTVVSSGEIIEQDHIAGGSAELKAVTTEAVRLPLLSGERDSLRRRVSLFNVTAPISQGQPVGHVEFFTSAGGRERRLADLPLVAAEAVPQTILAKAVPVIGNQVALRSPVVRLLILGALCLSVVAILLIRRGNQNARRRVARKKTRSPISNRGGGSGRVFDEFDRPTVGGPRGRD